MMFVSSFGYYFDDLSYQERMTIHQRTTTTLLVGLFLVVFLLPSWGVGQQVGPFGQPPQTGQWPNGQANANARVAEFFCQWTPQVPTGRTQQQCVVAFTAFSQARTVQNFCFSMGTFCTVSHLTLCPRPDTVTACRTCLPHFQRVCQQQQQQQQQPGWQG